jgi:hypothetical protein
VDFREKSLKKPHLSSSEMGFRFPRAIRPPCELNPDDTWGRLRFQMDSIQIGRASQGGERKAKKGTKGSIIWLPGSQTGAYLGVYPIVCRILPQPQVASFSSLSFSPRKP